MAQTSPERQRAYRQRLAIKAGERAAETMELRARVAELEADLADALAEVERLSAGPPCPHPSESVSEGVCRACGADVW